MMMMMINFQKIPKLFKKNKHTFHKQVTPDNGLYRVQKHSGQFWEIHLPIPTWNSDTFLKTWKDLKLYRQNLFLLFNETCLNEQLLPNYTYIYLYISKKVKLMTVVEGHPKAHFSVAFTPRCRGGSYSFPLIAPLYPWYVPYHTEG